MLLQYGNDEFGPMIQFNRISPNSSGEGKCYVRNGLHKYTKTGKPFVTLYLQDIDGNVIPGYIFDIKDFEALGFQLSEVIHSVVQIKYTENFLKGYGLTLIIDKISIVDNADAKLLGKFVGTVEQATTFYPQLADELSNLIGKKVNVPYTICTGSYIDFKQGEIGGLCLHYMDMLSILKSFATMFKTEEERKQLYGTFLLFIYSQSNYLPAEDDGCANITLVTQLTANLAKYIKVLDLGDGALEVVHIFFGYEPKDIYVRLVKQVSDMVQRASKEIAMFNTLPPTREGNAGYGTILRYGKEDD